MATDSEMESLSSGLARSVSLGSAGEESDPVDTADSPRNQISQLQDMVTEMRDGFAGAIQALTKIQYGDQVLKETVDSNKAQYEQQLADVVQMVLALKTEFGGMVGQLEVATESQKSLQQQVATLQYERDILLEELERDGAIAADVREKYHSGRSRPNGLNKSSDSTTLAVLLDRARTVFHSSPHSGSHVTSDHDSGVNTGQPGDMSSCEEVTPPLVSPRVQSYINGLSEEADHVDDLPLDEHYDSDSSVTAAANKSLDLSRSLGDQCTNLTHCSSDDEAAEGKPAADTEEKIVPETVQPVQATPKRGEPFESDQSSPCDISPPRSVAPHERNARENQRSRIAREILDTEKKYCSSLWTAIDHFAVPLKQANILSNKEVSTMFPQCLWRIYGHHCLFLQKLENRLANWKWQCVLGDIFAQFVDASEGDLLKQYQTYVNEFPMCLHQIRKSYRQSSRFKKFLKACHRHPCCGGLDIGAYLLTPIQRMPRYVLLLKNLLKFTDLEHPDHYYIEQSLQKLSSFLTELNESIMYSMKAVTEDGTPKPKRKFRAQSMRSTSTSSYQESRPLSGASSQSALPKTRTVTRLSSPSSQSGVANIHDMSSISYSDNMAADTASPGFDYSATLPSNASRPRDRTTFIHPGDSTTLPPGDRRRKLRQRRPRSALDHMDIPEIVYPEERREPRADYKRPTYRQQQQQQLQRPMSMMDRLSGDSFRSQASSDYNVPQYWSQATSQESLNTVASHPARRVGPQPMRAYPPRPHTADYSTMPGRGRADCRVAQPGYHSPDFGDMLHQSMPRLNQEDYGIYGDNDDNDIDDTVYPPQTPGGTTRQVAHTNVTPMRSKSHGDGLHRDPDLDVTQDQLNLALARSLTEDQLMDRLPRKASTPYVDPRTRMRPGNRQVHPTPLNRPVKLSDNLWEEPADISFANSTLNESRTGGKKKDKKKRQMNTSSLMDVSCSEQGQAKKKSFSFRSIFFKKRKQDPSNSPSSPTVGDVDPMDENRKVVAIQDDQPTTPASQPVDPASVMSHDSIREQAAPSDDTVMVETVQRHIELESYEDENGDPCSAV